MYKPIQRILRPAFTSRFLTVTFRSTLASTKRSVLTKYSFFDTRMSGRGCSSGRNGPCCGGGSSAGAISTSSPMFMLRNSLRRFCIFRLLTCVVMTLAGSISKSIRAQQSIHVLYRWFGCPFGSTFRLRQRQHRIVVRCSFVGTAKHPGRRLKYFMNLSPFGTLLYPLIGELGEKLQAPEYK